MPYYVLLKIHMFQEVMKYPVAMVLLLFILLLTSTSECRSRSRIFMRFGRNVLKEQQQQVFPVETEANILLSQYYR
uniref:Secreted protein n=2 Tax=Steinernema glaseri TaxID=37863 RepID=A0A1I8AHC1_9BILA